MNSEEAKKIAGEIEGNDTLGTDEENQLSEEELEVLSIEEIPVFGNDTYDAEYAGQFPDEDERDPVDDDEEEDEEEEDYDDLEEPARTEQITIVQQPVIIETSVGSEVGSKGEIRPFAKISVKRHLDLSGDANTAVWEVIASDFVELASMVEDYISTVKEGANAGERGRGNNN